MLYTPDTTVALGATYLDAKSGMYKFLVNWQNRIDLDGLYLAGDTTCILGQLYGSFRTATATLGLTQEKSVHYGFIAPVILEDYDCLALPFQVIMAREHQSLTVAWRSLLRRHRSQA